LTPADGKTTAPILAWTINGKTLRVGRFTMDWFDKEEQVAYERQIAHVAAGEEIPEFMPRRSELEELARYWADLHLHLEYLMWCYGQVSHIELLRIEGAAQRLDDVASHLGEDTVRKIVEQVKEKIQLSVDAHYWHCYTNGLPSPLDDATGN
jgi:hypothetical protein